MTQVISTKALVVSAGLTEAVTQAEKSGSDSHFYEFELPDQRVVAVESTADQIMDGLTTWPVDMQSKLFHEIVNKLPEPGDSIIIERDHVQDEKTRVAHIARLKDSQDASRGHTMINLLMTH